MDLHIVYLYVKILQRYVYNLQSSQYNNTLTHCTTKSPFSAALKGFDIGTRYNMIIIYCVCIYVYTTVFHGDPSTG